MGIRQAFNSLKLSALCYLRRRFLRFTDGNYIAKMFKFNLFKAMGIVMLLNAVCVVALSRRVPSLDAWSRNSGASQDWNPALTSDIKNLLQQMESGGNSAISSNLRKFAKFEIQKKRKRIHVTTVVQT